MRKQEPPASAAPPGFVLLDSKLSPIVVNRVAAEVLSFPQKPESTKCFDDLLVAKIRSNLLSRQQENGSPVVTEFRSGRRRYSCRSFRVDRGLKGIGHITIAILLERGASESVSIAQTAEKYHLTAREQDVLRFLLEGLPSKEIATRMEISPNTVKAFLRLIMIKMGVSARSAIIGRSVIPKS